MTSSDRRRDLLIRKLRADMGAGERSGPAGDTPIGSPTVMPRSVPSSTTHRLSSTAEHPIPPALTASIDAFASAHRAAGEDVVLAAAVAIIARYTATTDPLVALDVSGREGAVSAWQPTVGSIPFRDLVAQSVEARSRPAGEGWPDGQIVLSVTGTTRVADRTGAPPGRGVLIVAVRDDVTGLRADFDAGHHDHGLITRFLRHIAVMVDAAIDSPDCPTEDHDLLDTTDTALALSVNEGAGTPDGDGHLLARLHRAFADHAELVAIRDSGGALTYRELAVQVAELAGHVRRAVSDADGDRTVAILVRPSDKRWVVACLAVLFTGHPWLPLDPGTPGRRLRTVLDDVAPVAVVTERRLIENVPDGPWSVLDLDERSDADQRVAIEATPPAAPPARAAYCILTSGSTGIPRAVVVEHRNLDQMLDVFRDFEVGPGDRLLQFASPGFDVSIFEIFVALANGASLEIPTADERLSFRGLVRFLATSRVTVAEIPPVLAELIDPHDVPELRLLSLGGEPFPGSLVAPWLRAGRRVVNGYGTTETTVGCIFSDCTDEWTGSPPIGRPGVGQTAYLLDDHLRLVPPGAVGELYVAGTSVARGYLGQPAWTAERFVPCPFVGDGGRMYRTGDLGSVTADGQIMFLGRGDRQVKVRGQRVELGDIEATLASLPDVRQAVVHVGAADAAGRAAVTAFVVLAAGATVDQGDLRARVAERLPSYMVPNVFEFVDAIPLRPTGKVDMAALVDGPSAPGEGPERGDRRDSWLERLQRDCYDVVIPGVELDAADDFFTAGGTSIDAIRLLALIDRITGVDVPIDEFLARPSVAAVASLVEAGLGRDGQSGDAHGEPGPIEALQIVERPPLAIGQEQLWLLDQLIPRRETYNILEAYRVTGPLDIARLRRALARVCREHDALRTSFPDDEGRPWQRVDPASKLTDPASCLSVLHVGSEAAAVEVLRDELATSFDLADGPLLRASVIRLADGDHIVAMTLHHIISDLRSTEVLVEDLSKAYLDDGPGSTPARYGHRPERQCIDFAMAQRSAASAAIQDRNLAYWRRHLVGAPLQRTLPLDRPRPSRRSYVGDDVAFDVPEAAVARLDDVARRIGGTVFQVLFASYAVALFDRTGSSDLVVGTPLLGRDGAEYDRTMGFLANALPIRVDASDDPTFEELVARVRGLTLDALVHHEVNGAHIVESLDLRPDLSHEPLFQLAFGMYQDPERLFDVPGLTAERLQIAKPTALCDLTVELRRRADGRLQGMANYSTDLFDRRSIEELADRYGEILGAVLERPDVPLSTLIPAPWRKQSAVDRVARTSGSGARTVLDLVAARLAAAPSDPVIVDDSGELTIDDLNVAANRLANHLADLGAASHGDIVGLCLPRSREHVIAQLAVMKLGAAYLPMDPIDPKARNSMVTTDAGVRTVLTTAELLASVPRDGVSIFSVDAIVDDLSAASADDPGVRVLPDDIAYVMYTSGSTGRPKGVAATHTGVVGLANGLAALGVGASDTVLHVSHPGFDASTFETWASISYGARIAIHPAGRLDLAELRASMERFDVRATVFTPALMNVVTNTDPHMLDGLRLLLVGGEAMSVQHARQLLDELPDLELYNVYGPTETTTIVAVSNVSRELPENADGVPIGRTIGTATLFCGGDMEVAAVGAHHDELLIGGEGVARGYLHRPAATAERFVPDPTRPGSRLFRTGDRVERNADGQFVFLGRFDDQVKVRGVRVEPNEVATVIRRHAGVLDCAILCEGAAESARLIGFIVVEPGVDPSDVIAYAAQHLPRFMVPATLETVVSLPRTRAGKIDVRALADRRSSSEPDAGDPAPSLGAIVTDEWTVLLGQDVGPTDDFFEVGGNSLRAAQLAARLRKRLQIEFPLNLIFDHSTIDSMTEALAARLHQD